MTIENGTVRLGELDESNFLDACSLSVSDEQRAFVSSPVGIIARGYVYRGCGARVFTVLLDERIVGLALVREFTDEPIGYDLQQFMIDKSFQNRGVGSAALALLLDELRREGRYDHVEVCVKEKDAAALHVYRRAGFKDSGYIDPECSDCINLIHRFDKDTE